MGHGPPSCQPCDDTVLIVASKSLRALNTLSGNRSPEEGLGRCAPQRALQERATAKALAFCRRLQPVAGTGNDQACCELVGREVAGAREAHPPLRADACDLLVDSACVDPLDDQPADIRRILSTPSEFPNLGAGCDYRLPGCTARP